MNNQATEQVEDDKEEFFNYLIDKLDTIASKGKQFLQNITRSEADKEAARVVGPGGEPIITLERKVLTRRYRPKDAVDMIGVSMSKFDNAIASGLLPPPDMRTDTKRKMKAGYTINQINHARRIFGKAPSKPSDLLGVVIGIANLKGGAEKTTLCTNLAQKAALEGLSVLIVDTDPQGSITFAMGKNPNIDVLYEHTMAPYLLEDKEALEDAGFGPDAYKNLDYAIQDTYWDNIKIIPACMDCLTIDLELPAINQAAKIGTKQAVQKLRVGLQNARQKFDIILMDGTPSLNISTLNVFSACDYIYVPTPSAILDLSSTVAFVDLLHLTLSKYKTDGVIPNVPEIKFVISKVSKSPATQRLAQYGRAIFSAASLEDVLLAELHHSEEVSKAGVKAISVYEVKPSESDNPDRLRATTDMFDRVYNEVITDVKRDFWGIEKFTLGHGGPVFEREAA